VSANPLNIVRSASEDNWIQKQMANLVRKIDTTLSFGLVVGASNSLAGGSGYADFCFAEELFWSTRSLRRAISSARCSP
jgi:hypothetical protein